MSRSRKFAYLILVLLAIALCVGTAQAQKPDPRDCQKAIQELIALNRSDLDAEVVSDLAAKTAGVLTFTTVADDIAKLEGRLPKLQRSIRTLRKRNNRLFRLNKERQAVDRRLSEEIDELWRIKKKELPALRRMSLQKRREVRVGTVPTAPSRLAAIPDQHPFHVEEVLGSHLARIVYWEEVLSPRLCVLRGWSTEGWRDGGDVNWDPRQVIAVSEERYRYETVDGREVSLPILEVVCTPLNLLVLGDRLMREARLKADMGEFLFGRRTTP